MGLLAACGKKGPPLPPLARVPAPPANPQAARVGDDVYVWFTVPSANVSGQSPADVSAIELYAVTSVIPPGGPDITEAAVKIGTYPVHVPVPPPPRRAGRRAGCRHSPRRLALRRAPPPWCGKR